MAARSTLTVTSGTTVTSAWGNSVRDHVVPKTTSNDVSSEGQMAANTSTDQIVVHNGTSAVQFGGYGTPTAITAGGFTQTGYGGAESITGELTRYGNHYVANAVIAITSIMGAGSAGNVISISLTGLPAVTSQRCVGSYVFQDASTGFVYSGALLMIAGSSQMYMYGSGGTTAIGLTPSIGLDVSDTVWCQINYHDI